jgi:hypothetical protein
MLAPLITFPFLLVEPQKKYFTAHFSLVVKTKVADFHFIPLPQVKPVSGACVDGDPFRLRTCI